MNQAITLRTPRIPGLKRVALGLLLAMGGTLALTGWAQAHGPRGGGMHHAMHGGAGYGMGMDQPERMGRMVDRMLEGLNATPEQRSKIEAIAKAAATDLRAQREAGRSLHEQRLKLFIAPTVDARAVEALRQQQLAHHDQVSKRMTQAMLEVSAVLTPEQRAQMGERIAQRQARMQERRQRHLERQGAASAPAK